MNDDHLLPLESAARFYCKHRGLDPDRAIEVPKQSGLILPGRRVETRPTWMFVADELIDLHIKLQALQMAQREAQAANEPTRGQ